jgi:hypothetical protein
VLECPSLVAALRASHASSARTVAGPTLHLDFTTSTATLGADRFTFAPLNETAQRLVVAGGLENLTRSIVRTSVADPSASGAAAEHRPTPIAIASPVPQGALL